MSTKAVTVDGINQEFEGTLSFRSVCENVKEHLGPSRVVTEIFVDGVAMTLADEENLSETQLSEFGNLELKTRNVSDLFKESLAMAPQICQAMKMDITDLDEFIASEKYTDAQERIAELAALVEWLLQLITGLQSLGASRIDEMTFSGGSVIAAVQRMQVHLAFLCTEMANARWAEFRQRLTGDFSKEVNTWESLFIEMSDTWTPRPSVSGTSTN